MREDLRLALDYCRETQLRNVVFIMPFSIKPTDVRALREETCCVGMVIKNPDPEITATSSSEWLGCYSHDDSEWILPSRSGQFLFLGSAMMLTRQMIEQVQKAGHDSLVCRKGDGFSKVHLRRFGLWKLGDEVVRRLATLPAGHFVHRAVGVLRQVPLFRRLWHSWCRRGDTTTVAPVSAGSSHIGFIKFSQNQLELYRELLKRALRAAPKERFVRGRVMLVNAGLAAGGAERQVVNTLLGLQSRGFEGIEMVGEYLGSAPGLDFYAPLLAAAGIAARPLPRHFSLAEHGLSSIAPDVAILLGLAPPYLIEEIVNLAEEFRRRKPEIVHAWQDSTSIKCGIAAVIAGVPRLVLSSRNVNPTNFAYVQDYMKPAYLALAELPHILLVNNSQAGADDYCAWLGLARDRYRVLRNGVDLSGMKRASTSDRKVYRRKLKMPADTPIVGSVFRFWPEKRPLLWLAVAERVVDAIPNAHFLLIGDGPMRTDMERLIERGALRGRMCMPGADRDVAQALSSMDLFLLTSEFEGTPNVALEAQWLGLPVVATEAGGTREAVAEGRTGVVCNRPDPDLIASEVVDFLKNAERRKVAAEHGPRFIETHFGMQRMIHETLELYSHGGERNTQRYGIQYGSESGGTAR